MFWLWTIILSCYLDYGSLIKPNLLLYSLYFSFFIAWNYLNKDKMFSIIKICHLFFSYLLYRLKGNIPVMMFSPFGVCCACLWNLHSSLNVPTMLPFHLEYFSKQYVSGSSEMFIPFGQTNPFPIIHTMEINKNRR